jgi:hypothetical protein
MKKFNGDSLEDFVDSTARTSIDNVKARFRFATQGQITGIIGTGNKIYLVGAMRWSTNVGALWVVHNYQGSVKVKPISVDSQMTIAANSLGTIEVKYNNSLANVFIGVLELS